MGVDAKEKNGERRKMGLVIPDTVMWCKGISYYFRLCLDVFVVVVERRVGWVV